MNGPRRRPPDQYANVGQAASSLQKCWKSALRGLFEPNSMPRRNEGDSLSSAIRQPRMFPYPLNGNILVATVKGPGRAPLPVGQVVSNNPVDFTK